MGRVLLQGRRLAVQELPPSAAAAVAAFHRENWDFHRSWDPYRNSDYFTRRTQRRILAIEGRNRDIIHLWLTIPVSEPSLTGAIWKGQSVIGTISLSNIVRGFLQSCYLGYKIGAPFARQGYMTEALSLVIPYAFGELALHRIEANVIPENEASLALLRKHGFREEGLSRRYLKIQGAWRDHRRMALLSDEWRGTIRGRE